MTPDQMTNSSLLKERLGAIEKNVKAAKEDMAIAKQRYDICIKEKMEIEELLRNLNKSIGNPRVSDHALLRYVERVMGIDVESLRTKIMDENMLTAIKNNATKLTRDGAEYIIRDQTVVTVIC